MSDPFATPRAAYIHVPFCRHRCGYCNFTLVAGRDDLFDDYARALEIELAGLGRPHEVDSLFFGGGTPTQLTPALLERVTETAKLWFPLAGGYEFTVEANPADVDAQMCELLAGAGVNRLSLGGQSFEAGKLRMLERDHSPDELRTSFEIARNWFGSVSLDLIFGVPGESLEIWEKDLQTTLELVPDHVSTYGLTYERGTAFWSRLSAGEIGRVDEEIERDMYLLAIDTLAAAGFEHYEVSSFARPGQRCRHNQVYWSGASYFAAGPGAARYVDGRREINHRSTATYLKRVLAGQSPVAEQETLSSEERARETLVFGLRRLAGVNRQEFQLQTGYALDELAGEPLGRMVERGLLLDDGAWVRLSRAGLLVSDAIWPDLLAAAEQSAT
ncbi:MAG TPA: radical SAM family heme chaperone HemW [Pirellulales bacterium]|jgi:oxygen-independent coproporphyrinogen-3 oxidase|nr:radical SAM family heme chaperone HemW [Pirellulales bacterium]